MAPQDDRVLLEMEFRDPRVIFNAKKLRETADFCHYFLPVFDFVRDFDLQDESVMDQNHHIPTAEWSQVF